MSYRNVLSYLTNKTAVVELSNKTGSRVAVCPQWNAYVMTSCADGFESQSFGFVNVSAIDRCDKTDVIQNFGGEDIWKVSPITGCYEVVNDTADEILLTRNAVFADANGKTAQVDFERKISLLQHGDILAGFGETVADAVRQPDVLSVGFRSDNAARSNSNPVLSSRQWGMFNAAQHTAVLVPIPESESENEYEMEQFPYRVDFLGGSPHHRIRHLPGVLLFNADGESRCQLSVRRKNLKEIFGSVNFRDGIVTLWAFDVPDLFQENKIQPFETEADSRATASDNFVRVYNHGKTPFEKSALKYYEINSFSAPQKLYPDESLTYRHFTLHIAAANDILDDIFKEIFGYPYQQIYDKMIR